MPERPVPAIHPSSYVDEGARLGDGVSVGAFSFIGAGVSLGAGTRVGSHCVLGEGNDEPLEIGARSIIRSHTVIYGGSTIGDELDTGHQVTIREGMRIGRNLRVGTNCDLQGRSTVGDFVRMTANIHVTQHSTIGDFVWMFAWILTTNDPHPPSDSCTRGPVIGRGAVITSNVTILPHVTIGAGAFVAAGSIVTRDVEPERVVRGQPARDVGSIHDIVCQHGHDEIRYPWWTHFHRGYPPEVTFHPDGPRYESTGHVTP